MISNLLITQTNAQAAVDAGSESGDALQTDDQQVFQHAIQDAKGAQSSSQATNAVAEKPVASEQGKHTQSALYSEQRSGNARPVELQTNLPQPDVDGQTETGSSWDMQLQSLVNKFSTAPDTDAEQLALTEGELARLNGTEADSDEFLAMEHIDSDSLEAIRLPTEFASALINQPVAQPLQTASQADFPVAEQLTEGELGSLEPVSIVVGGMVDSMPVEPGMEVSDVDAEQSGEADDSQPLSLAQDLNADAGLEGEQLNQSVQSAAEISLDEQELAVAPASEPELAVAPAGEAGGSEAVDVGEKQTSQPIASANSSTTTQADTDMAATDAKAQGAGVSVSGPTAGNLSAAQESETGVAGAAQVLAADSQNDNADGLKDKPANGQTYQNQTLKAQQSELSGAINQNQQQASSDSQSDDREQLTKQQAAEQAMLAKQNASEPAEQPELRSTQALNQAATAVADSQNPSSPEAARGGNDINQTAATQQLRATNNPASPIDTREQIQQKLEMQQEKLAPALGQRLMMMVNSKQQFAEIKLDPPELGSMMVRVQVQNDQAQLHVVAQHSQTRDMLEQAMPRLRELMQEQGLQLADAQVGRQDRQEQGGLADGQAQQGFSATGSEEEGDVENIANEPGEVRYFDTQRGIDFYA